MSERPKLDFEMCMRLDGYASSSMVRTRMANDGHVWVNLKSRVWRVNPPSQIVAIVKFLKEVQILPLYNSKQGYKWTRVELLGSGGNVWEAVSSIGKSYSNDRDSGTAGAVARGVGPAGEGQRPALSEGL